MSGNEKPVECSDFRIGVLSRFCPVRDCGWLRFLKQDFSFKPLIEGLHETREETDFRKRFELSSVCVLTFGLNLVIFP